MMWPTLATQAIMMTCVTLEESHLLKQVDASEGQQQTRKWVTTLLLMSVAQLFPTLVALLATPLMAQVVGDGLL
jgi:hypothetical protein